MTTERSMSCPSAMREYSLVRWGLLPGKPPFNESMGADGSGRVVVGDLDWLRDEPKVIVMFDVVDLVSAALVQPAGAGIVELGHDRGRGRSPFHHAPLGRANQARTDALALVLFQDGNQADVPDSVGRGDRHHAHGLARIGGSSHQHR